MIRSLPVALCAVLLVSGCGSRLNPMTWFDFGRSGPADAVNSEDTVPAEVPAGGEILPLVAGLKSLSAEPIPGGVILHAVGVSPRQAYHSAELVPVPTDDAGVMVFDFVALPPDVPTAVGSERSRELTVATKLTNRGLEGIRLLRVRSASNTLSVRR
ncbi:hypothetical protein [Donghicola sp. XS_ASV15]|uniref:hypothetical protein n=1 Tax=Donghicola sp. XS_ASV15 TaxID=3241295 RepID=UPI0035150515